MHSLRPSFFTLLIALSSQCRQAIAASDFSNADPDIWGSVPISAPRLDRPYPGRWESPPSPDAGWHVDLKITGQRILEDDKYNRNETLVTMHFRPPAPGLPGSLFDAESGNWSVASNITSTWKLTLVSLVWGTSLDKFREVDDWNDGVDGSCPPSVVSETCVRELRQHIASSPRVRNGTQVQNFAYGSLAGPHEGDPDHALPPSGSCAEYFDKYYARRVELNSNFTDTNHDIGEKFTTDENGNDLGAFDAVGRKTFPVIMVWGHGNDTEVGEAIPEDYVTVACVKATNVKEGVEEPKGAAGSLRGARWWEVGLAGAAALVFTELLF